MVEGEEVWDIGDRSKGGGGSNGMMGGKKGVKREGRQRDDGEGVKGEGGGLAKLAECIS